MRHFRSVPKEGRLTRLTNSGRHFVPQVRDDEQALTNDISIRTRPKMNATHVGLLRECRQNNLAQIASALI